MNRDRRDNCIRKRCSRRVAAVLCAAAVAALQCLALWPALAENAYAETPGEILSVRVQYFGERGDMIREKARFTREELEAMGAQTWYYSNVTRVGTVMSMAAYGPEVMSIIEASGIDPGSISNITFRTTDGYTRNFTVESHLSGGRFFYPNLSSLYETNEDSETLTPLEGALEGGYEVPAILALTFGATKAPGVEAETISQGTKETYRFCMGQTPLTEGQPTRPGQDGGDVSSMDSVHSIYGMDVTLKGSPVSGIGIDPIDSDLKIGSVTKVTIRVEGDELFAEDYTKALGKLTWSSSDPAIASVDQKGNVTILKEGTATITVKAENGMTASVTINGSGKAAENNREPAATTRATAPEKPPQQTVSTARERQETTASSAPEAENPKVHIRELSLGEEIKEDPEQTSQQHAISDDTSALKEQEPYAPGTAAGAASVAAVAFGAGGVHRLRRFLQLLKGWKR